MDLLDEAGVLMELAFLRDGVDLLAEVACHLEDGQVFETLHLRCGFRFQGLTTGFRGLRPGFKFHVSELPNGPIHVSELPNGEFQVSEAGAKVVVNVEDGSADFI